LRDFDVKPVTCKKFAPEKDDHSKIWDDYRVESGFCLISLVSIMILFVGLWRDGAEKLSGSLMMITTATYAVFYSVLFSIKMSGTNINQKYKHLCTAAGFTLQVIQSFFK
jgi:hypothetical protein